MSKNSDAYSLVAAVNSEKGSHNLSDNLESYGLGQRKIGNKTGHPEGG
ncbi:MAG: hypothetical protein QNJ46_27970 [Leptolyngbyaceae cyanobacterium MO_188.B28]|nr:hypothetical protein [Leptolyngbyaceae cyanobacterium MO_188.B28]